MNVKLLSGYFAYSVKEKGMRILDTYPSCLPGELRQAIKEWANENGLKGKDAVSLMKLYEDSWDEDMTLEPVNILPLSRLLDICEFIGSDLDPDFDEFFDGSP